MTKAVKLVNGKIRFNKNLMDDEEQLFYDRIINKTNAFKINRLSITFKFQSSRLDPIFLLVVLLEEKKHINNMIHFLREHPSLKRYQDIYMLERSLKKLKTVRLYLKNFRGV